MNKMRKLKRLMALVMTAILAVTLLPSWLMRGGTISANAATTVTHTFDASSDLSALDKSAVIATGTTYDNGYFTVTVADNKAKRANDNTYAIELPKKSESDQGIQFTVPEGYTAKVNISARGAGKDKTGKLTLNGTEQSYDASTVSANTWSDLASGTYVIYATSTDGGTRITKIVVTLTEIVTDTTTDNDSANVTDNSESESVVTVESDAKVDKNTLETPKTSTDNVEFMTKRTSGWLETAYAEWSPVADADGYTAYVKKATAADTEYTKLDNELIRQYTDYYRVDAVGLTAGDYVLKVVPVKDGVELTAKAAVTDTLTVTAYDRSGFAFSTTSTLGTGSGAYNEDGTLKSNAIVLYVTDNNAKTIKATLTTDAKKGKTAEFTGLQTIIDAYTKYVSNGNETRSLDIRVIGCLTLDGLDKISSSEEGLQIKGSSEYTNLHLTFEGIGDDACVNGFGFLLRNAGNVELRNFSILNFMDDGVSIDTDNCNLWIHNIDLYYGKAGGDSDQAKGDGSIDIKGDSKYITVSYVHFYDSGKCSLCGMKSESGPNYITYHHNWFDHSDSRHARVRTMSVYMYNNYYDGNSKYGVGATMGSSIFMQNNYFRNCKYPMLSSKQGTDAQGEGTFSGENGGIIKAYGNIMVGAKQIIYANATSDTGTAADATSFDAYLASSADEQVPSTYTTVSGGTTYNNFDTDEDIDLGVKEGSLIDAEDVPLVVTSSTGAGSLGGGVILWEFDDSTADESYAIDSELKSAVTNYENTTLVSVGGVDSANVTETTEGNSSSTGSSTGSTGSSTSSTGSTDSSTSSTGSTESSSSTNSNSSSTTESSSSNTGSADNSSTSSSNSGSSSNTSSTTNSSSSNTSSTTESSSSNTGSADNSSTSSGNSGSSSNTSSTTNSSSTSSGSTTVTTVVHEYYVTDAKGKDITPADDYFTIADGSGTAKATSTTYGTVLSSSTVGLKMESKTSITFTCGRDAKLLIVLDSNKNVKLDGEKISATTVDGNYIITYTLTSGAHTITKGDTTNLMYMSVTDETAVANTDTTVEDTKTETSTDNSNATVDNSTTDNTQTEDKNVDTTVEDTKTETSTDNSNTTVDNSTTDNSHATVDNTTTDNSNTTVDNSTTDNSNTTVDNTTTDNSNTAVDTSATDNSNTTVDNSTTDNTQTEDKKVDTTVEDTKTETSTDGSNTTVDNSTTDNTQTEDKKVDTTVEDTKTETSTDNSNATVDNSTTDNTQTEDKKVDTTVEDTKTETSTDNSNTTVDNSTTDNTQTEDKNVDTTVEDTKTDTTVVLPDADKFTSEAVSDNKDIAGKIEDNAVITNAKGEEIKPENTCIALEEVKDKATEEKVIAALKTSEIYIPATVEQKLVDIHLEDAAGNQLKLADGKVRVTVKLDGVDYSKNKFEVYHIVNGEAVKMNILSKEGGLTFDTDGFSPFVITYELDTTVDTSANAVSTDNAVNVGNGVVDSIVNNIGDTVTSNAVDNVANNIADNTDNTVDNTTNISAVDSAGTSANNSANVISNAASTNTSATTSSPSTGDMSGLYIYMIMLLISVACVSTCVIAVRRRILN